MELLMLLKKKSGKEVRLQHYQQWYPRLVFEVPLRLFFYRTPMRSSSPPVPTQWRFTPPQRVIQFTSSQQGTTPLMSQQGGAPRFSSPLPQQQGRPTPSPPPVVFSSPQQQPQQQQPQVVVQQKKTSYHPNSNNLQKHRGIKAQKSFEKMQTAADLIAAEAERLKLECREAVAEVQRMLAEHVHGSIEQQGKS